MVYKHLFKQSRKPIEYYEPSDVTATHEMVGDGEERYKR